MSTGTDGDYQRLRPGMVTNPLDDSGILRVFDKGNHDDIGILCPAIAPTPQTSNGA